jgi:RNA polymerase sigma-B factor
MTVPEPTAVIHVELASEPGGLRAARRTVTDALPDLRSIERADLMLVISELVAAVTGDGSVPAVLDLRRTETGLRVDVRADRSSDALDELAVALLNELTAEWDIDAGHGWVEFVTSSRFRIYDEDQDLFLRNAAGELSARDELADRYRGFAMALARRFVKAGVRREDLNQVASVGLVNALERFDPGRGVKFTTYAARTIEGELKRHLRDAGWSIRVPRGLQELGLEAVRTSSDLTQQRGTPPTLAELADALDADETEVGQALLARRSFDSASLDAPVRGEENLRLMDAIPAHDERLSAAPEWSDLSRVMDHLPERERRILYLRFFEDLSQSEIAGRVGVSQMHVSRLLAKSIAQLRAMIDPDRHDADHDAD